MKQFVRFLSFVFLMTIFVSCESLGGNIYHSSSWSQGKTLPHTIRLEKVSADLMGGGVSVKNEIAGLAPLFFAGQGYGLAAENETAEYAVDIRAREREFASGWRTRRSFSMEVRIWRLRDGSVIEALPLAAGRVTASGDRGFSSSEITGRMLNAAIRRTVSALHAAERKTGKGITK
ncbi:MAG: hypothetical protein LBN21_09250 [Treponema sp.]|jgi:hypothetical protein|nr:hypothetical protein [Treponema sp.]